MLEALKRWFSPAAAGPDWTVMSAWTRQQGWGFKRVRVGEGFAVDGRFGDMPWRLEWGPSQRAYISGHELRMRMELQLPPDLQMLVLSRSLMESLERQTFEQFTQTSQTLIDSTTPEEMRWLAMFPKVNLLAARNLRSRFGAVSSDPSPALSWLEGALAEQLEAAAAEWLPPEAPFVLMTMRGRLYMRLQLGQPEPAAVARAIRLFDVAAQNACRVGSGEAATGNEWPSTAISAWQTIDTEDSRPMPDNR